MTFYSMKQVLIIKIGRKNIFFFFKSVRHNITKASKFNNFEAFSIAGVPIIFSGIIVSSRISTPITIKINPTILSMDLNLR